MKTIFKISIVLLFFTQALSAQQNSIGPHGGRLKSVGNYKIELLGCDNYLEVYLFDRDTNSVNNNGITGNVEYFYNQEATLSSPLTHYGMDGFTAKIPVNTFVYTKVLFKLNGEMVITTKFDNECLKKN